MSENIKRYIDTIDKKRLLDMLGRFTYFGADYKGFKGFDKTGSIKLRCGVLSDWYVDVRSLLLCDSEYVLQYIHKAITDMRINTPIRTNQIMGYGYGGAILVSALNGLAQYNGLIIRSEKKEYGMKDSIIGNPYSKDVILIEDVFTSGGSLCTAIQIAESKGYTIRGIVVVMDRCVNRCVKGFEHIRKEIKEKYVYRTIFNKDDIAEIRRMK